jgi:hypothetical protein
MSRAQLTSTVEQNTGGAVAPYVAGKNAIINGGFDIWQRGTSAAGTVATAGTGYLADRWQNYRSVAGSTFSRQSSGLTGFQYNMRVQRDSGNTNTANPYLGTSVEILQAQPFVGQTITLSFYARAGSNYSSASNGLNASVVSGTNASDACGFINGYTAQSTVITQNATLTTSWQRFSYTGTIGSTSTQFYLAFTYTPVGTAGVNDYFEVTGVQVEIGNVATPFSKAGGTIQCELAACQRYYFRNTGALTYFGSGGIAGSATQCYVQVKSPTTMRVAPTTLDYSLLLLQYISGSVNVTSASISTANPDITIVLANTASGLTATTQSYMLMTQNNAAAYLGLSAEL